MTTVVNDTVIYIVDSIRNVAKNLNENYYTMAQVYPKAEVYTKENVNEALATKANTTDVYTKLEVNDTLADMRDSIAKQITDSLVRFGDKEWVNAQIATNNGSYLTKADVEDTLNYYLMKESLKDSLANYTVTSIRQALADTLAIYRDTVFSDVKDTLNAYWDTTGVKNHVNKKLGDYNLMVFSHINGFVPYVRDTLANFWDSNAVRQFVKDTLGDFTTALIADKATEEWTKGQIHDTLEDVIRPLIDAKADAVDMATALEAKANAADVYTKDDVETKLNDKANKDEVYTIGDINDTLADLRDTIAAFIHDTAVVLRAEMDAMKAEYEAKIASLNLMLAKNNSGALTGEFTIDSVLQKKVRFSKGNLQYRDSDEKWRFATNQYDYTNNSDAYADNSKQWIDHFAWGTSGWSEAGISIDVQPWDLTSDDDDLYKINNDFANDMTGVYANADWGVFNSISNAGDEPNMWRTLTAAELDTLFNHRTGTYHYAKAQIGTVGGVMLFPDNFILPDGITVNNLNTDNVNYSVNTYTTSEWNKLEAAGVVFMPAAGYFKPTGVSPEYIAGITVYWTSTTSSNAVKSLRFTNSTLNTSNNGARNRGFCVRLVQDVK